MGIRFQVPVLYMTITVVPLSVSFYNRVVVTCALEIHTFSYDCLWLVASCLYPAEGVRFLLAYGTGYLVLLSDMPTVWQQVLLPQGYS